MFARPGDSFYLGTMFVKLGLIAVCLLGLTSCASTAWHLAADNPHVFVIPAPPELRLTTFTAEKLNRQLSGWPA
jgi:hypothetical protein